MVKSLKIVSIMLIFSSSLAMADTVNKRLEKLEKSVEEIKDTLATPAEREYDGVAAEDTALYTVSNDCDKIKSYGTLNDTYKFKARKTIECSEKTYYVVEVSNHYYIMDASDAVFFD